jgi:hypothetical protein
VRGRLLVGAIVLAVALVASWTRCGAPAGDVPPADVRRTGGPAPAPDSPAESVARLPRVRADAQPPGPASDDPAVERTREVVAVAGQTVEVEIDE